MQENQQQVPVLTLQLNLDQINVILTQLGKIPYETIAPLMATIRGQAGQQLEQLQAQAAAAQQSEDVPATPAE